MLHGWSWVIWHLIAGKFRGTRLASLTALPSPTWRPCCAPRTARARGSQRASRGVWLRSPISPGHPASAEDRSGVLVRSRRAW